MRREEGKGGFGSAATAWGYAEMSGGGRAAGATTFGGGGGGRLGDSGGRRRGLLSRGVLPANNKPCTNPAIGVKVVAVDDNRNATMNVSLTPELEKFVASEVETGLYQTASEVIRAGLRRLKHEKERLPTGPQTAEELDEALLRSLQRLDRGQGVGGAKVARRLRERMRAHRPRR